MNPLISAARQSVERELVITRIFDAPRELVFKAWTEPERLARWTGPEGFTTVSDTMDVRPGGSFHACIRSPEGIDRCMRGSYREVVEPELLVFTFTWEDADGRPGREMLVSVSFAEEGGKTRMIFHQAVFESAEDQAGRREGWSSSFNLLESYLQVDPPTGTEPRGYAAVHSVGERAFS